MDNIILSTIFRQQSVIQIIKSKMDAKNT